jgi:hypothetical protein
MTKIITNIYRISHYHRERLLSLFIISILLTMFAYIFLLQKAIINVVQRQEVSKSISKVSVDVSNLEEEYFSLKNGITLELAHTKGMKDAEVVSYISKSPITAMVRYNEF